LPLEVTAELGIIGAILVIALYGAVFRLTWRLRRDPLAWLAGPAAVLFLIVNLVDWPWHLAGAGAVWAVAVGVLLGQAGFGTSSRTPRP
jgi:O-antigen ligase